MYCVIVREEFWKELLLVTDRRQFERKSCYNSGPLKLIGQLSHDVIGCKTPIKTTTFHLIFKMTFAQVVETSVTNNSSFQNFSHPDGPDTIRTGVKLLTKRTLVEFCTPIPQAQQSRNGEPTNHASTSCFPGCKFWCRCR